MKKINWGSVFENIAFIGAMCIGIGILHYAFTFIVEIIKTIF